MSRRGNYITGIENLWNQSKRVLRKYNGTPRKHFFLFLKKCEFRFNHRHGNLYRAVLKLLRSNPL